MSVIFPIEVPDSRWRGQGVPVDYLVEVCIKEGVHDIHSMEPVYKAIRTRKQYKKANDDLGTKALITVSECEEYKSLGFEIEATQIWRIEAN